MLALFTFLPETAVHIILMEVDGMGVFSNDKNIKKNMAEYIFVIVIPFLFLQTSISCTTFLNV